MPILQAHTRHSWRFKSARHREHPRLAAHATVQVTPGIVILGVSELR